MNVHSGYSFLLCLSRQKSRSFASACFTKPSSQELAEAAYRNQFDSYRFSVALKYSNFVSGTLSFFGYLRTVKQPLAVSLPVTRCSYIFIRSGRSYSAPRWRRFYYANKRQLSEYILSAAGFPGVANGRRRGSPPPDPTSRHQTTVPSV